MVESVGPSRWRHATARMRDLYRTRALCGRVLKEEEMPGPSGPKNPGNPGRPPGPTGPDKNPPMPPNPPRPH